MPDWLKHNHKLTVINMKNNDEWKLIPVVAILVALDTEKKESAELSFYIF